MSARSRQLVAGVAVLGLAVGTVVLWLNRRELEELSWVAGTLGTGVGTVVALVAVWRWSEGRPGLHSSTPYQLSQAQRKLREVVLTQWREEAAIRQLDDPKPLAVTWRLDDPELMDHLDNTGLDGGRLFTSQTDHISELARQFRSLRRRRLVIIGDAGMGKTTLAVLLLRELLSHPHQGEPVPVLFSLASWDPVADSFHDWLTHRLTRDYPMLRVNDYGSSAPATLVRSRRILPVLDGLDELPESARSVALTALNAVLTDADQFILTCRTREYRDAVSAAGGRVLRAAVVVSPGALELENIGEYLRACLSPQQLRTDAWHRFLEHLYTEPTSPLVGALSTPLALWLLRVVYINTDRDPAELTVRTRFPTPRSVSTHLLDNLVGATLGSRPPVVAGDEITDSLFRPRRQWREQDVWNWLSYLAVHLRDLGTRDLAWWRLPYAVPRRQRRVIGAVIGGLLGGLLYGLTIGLVVPLPTGLAVGVVEGLTIGVAIGLLVRSTVADRTYAALGWFERLRVLVTRLIVVLAVGMTPGSGVSMAAGLPVRVAIGLSLGLSIAMTASITVGLVSGLRVDGPIHANLRLRGRELLLIKQLISGIAFALAAGLAVGVVVGLTFALGLGRQIGIQIGVIGVLAMALAIGIAFGLREWARTPLKSAYSSTPSATLRADLSLAALTVVTVGLCFGISFSLQFGPARGIPFGLTLGLAAGLASRQAGPVYLVAKVYLWMTRRLPWRMMTFLQDVHRLGLVRQVGAVYQFRHADLHDRLATNYLAQGSVTMAQAEQG